MVKGTFWKVFLQGVRYEIPLLFGVVPFGMIYGVLALQAGLSPLQAQAMSLVVFAGSAQFMVVQLVVNAVPWVLIVLTGLIINLRHMLYSASLAPWLQGLAGRWKAGLAYLLTDEAYAVTATYYRSGDVNPHGHAFFLGAGLTLWASWQVSTMVGISLGSLVPASWGLDFALPLTFIALVVPNLRHRADVLTALAAGALALLLAGLPYKLGLLLASLCAIAFGTWLEERS